MAVIEDEFAELIKEIAAKHHLLIGRDDPILVLQTINNRLMQNSARAQRELLDAFRSEIESISQQWSQDAKGKADRALSASVSAATEAALQVLEGTSTSASAAIRSEIKTGTQRLAHLMKRTEKAVNLNLAAALLMLIAVSVAAIWFWHHG